jgi:hypothetical protein
MHTRELPPGALWNVECRPASQRSAPRKSLAMKCIGRRRQPLLALPLGGATWTGQGHNDRSKVQATLGAAGHTDID